MFAQLLVDLEQLIIADQFGVSYAHFRKLRSGIVGCQKGRYNQRPEEISLTGFVNTYD